MQFKASARYVKRSPYKLRPIIDVVRGKSARYALDWLYLHAVKKAESIRKVVASAAANAKDKDGIEVEKLFVKEIKVDQGPVRKYFKPGPMGRAKILRKRSSHISVVLESIDKK